MLLSNLCYIQQLENPKYASLCMVSRCIYIKLVLRTLINLYYDLLYKYQTVCINVQLLVGP